MKMININSNRMDGMIIKKKTLTVVTAMLFCGLALNSFGQGQTEVTNDLTVQIDFSESIGEVKLVNGVNGGPWKSAGHIRDMTILHKEAGFPSVRLHDCNWPHPDVVDVPTIFPLFHLDPDDPSNYTFEKTDAYLKPIIENGAEIVFRLGVSIEHEQTFNTNPPEDFKKWAKICVNILRHYNDGWADGFHYNIRHAEIWNEPNGKKMWTGTDEQYFDLYRASVTAIKEYNPKILVGGPATSSPTSRMVAPFLEYCKKHKLPVDFFSWHMYPKDVEFTIKKMYVARDMLDKHGFTETESWCTEWKPLGGEGAARWRPGAAPHSIEKTFAKLRNHRAAAMATCILLQMQDAPIDMAYFYSADTSPWSMFDGFGEPGHVYFAMKAFNQFARNSHRVRVVGAPGKNGISLNASVSNDKTQAMILAANFKSASRYITVNMKNLPWIGDNGITTSAWCIDEQHKLTPIPIAIVNQTITIDLPQSTTLLIKLEDATP